MMSIRMGKQKAGNPGRFLNSLFKVHTSSTPQKVDRIPLLAATPRLSHELQEIDSVKEFV